MHQYNYHHKFYNFRYLKGAKIGEEVTVSAKASKIGKTLAFLTVDLHDSQGRLLAQGKHTKYVGDSG